MNKIIIFAVSGNEEQIFSDIQEYLKLKTDFVNISLERTMKLSFVGLEFHRFRISYTSLFSKPAWTCIHLPADL